MDYTNIGNLCAIHADGILTTKGAKRFFGDVALRCIKKSAAVYKLIRSRLLLMPTKLSTETKTEKINNIIV